MRISRSAGRPNALNRLAVSPERNGCTAAGGLAKPGLGARSQSGAALLTAMLTVTLVATITELLPKQVATISTVITKQTGQVVVDGESTVKLPGWLMKKS